MLVAACNRVALFRLCIFRAYRPDWLKVTDTRKSPPGCYRRDFVPFLSLSPSSAGRRAMHKGRRQSNQPADTLCNDVSAWRGVKRTLPPSLSASWSVRPIFSQDLMQSQVSRSRQNVFNLASKVNDFTTTSSGVKNFGHDFHVKFRL